MNAAEFERLKARVAELERLVQTLRRELDATIKSKSSTSR